MTSCDHDYSGFEHDHSLRRVCLRCLQPAPTVTLTVEALERVVREAWYSGAGTTLRACGAEWTDAELDRECTAYVARVLREIGGGR